ncbi:response regulator transcription factor [Paenibacillus albus]|uniref:Response regulator n=1 Tax=Paenibacillus albus TaxID=2495582 RepID=A0A3S9A9T1_9BACL|nr:response regulator [Paenibacillus albus]AZN42464.1 response regulator [Paenibacillus albus]
MIKLMVIDDEHWIREGLKQTIDWESYGVQFICDAEDGIEALKLIEANPPDIIISDIRMPSMDGMELFNELKNREIDVKVIFISGFDDFAYAQKAIKLGASDYILKPIEEHDLIAVVERCVGEIKQKNEMNFKMEELSGRVRESLPLAKQKHLEMCLSRPISEQELLSKWETLQIDLNPNELIVLSVVVHEWGERRLDESDCSLLRYAIGNLIEEVFKEAGIRALACPLHDNEYSDVALIVSSCKEDADSQYNEVVSCANRVTEEAFEVLGVRISIGVSSRGDSRKLLFTFREALTNSMEYITQGTGLVFGPTGTDKGPMNVAGVNNVDDSYSGIKVEALDMAWLNRIIHAIKLRDESRLSDLLDQQIALLQDLVQETSALAVRREMNTHIGMLLSKWQDMCGARDNSDSSYALMYYQKLQLYRSPLNNWKHAVMSAFLNKDNSAPGFGQRYTIDAALQFIQDNYHLEIGLNSVAKRIFLNPSYLSRVFHAEVGETFSRYLTRVRIAKAKELLDQTPLKIYEVAEQVGYKDFRYFVKTFKELEGITPSQYRNYGA